MSVQVRVSLFRTGLRHPLDCPNSNHECWWLWSSRAQATLISRMLSERTANGADAAAGVQVATVDAFQVGGGSLLSSL